MKICRYFFLLVFLSFFPSVRGQSVLLTGSGNGYKNAELRFFCQTDPITKRLKPILNITCDEKGTFSCAIPYSKNDIIYIKTGIFNLHFYLTDSVRYELNLPDFEAKPMNEEQNPFFTETDLIPEVVSNKQDVNNLIKAFDFDYNPIFNLVAERVFINYKKDEIQQVISKLNKYIGVNEPSFYTDYVKGRMMMLNLIWNQDHAEAIALLNNGFNTGNQALTDLAEQMFSGYLNELSSGLSKESFSRAIATASLSELRSVIQQKSKIANKELIDFIILLNLNEDYYTKNLKGENIRKIISLIKSEGATVFIQNVASTVLDKMDYSIPGNSLPDFLLLNSDGKLMSLKDFRGKYLLLCFVRADNQSSLTELGIINIWQQKFINDVNIAVVLTDKDFKSSSRLLKNRGFKYIFLDGSQREKLEFDYDIKMYPSFILMDREGKIIADPCPYPSENLELTLVKLLLVNPVHSGSENR
jgi:peroxiredoxin